MTPENSHLQPELFLCDKCAKKGQFLIGRIPRNTLSHHLAPGIWVDMEGNIHLSITDMMKFFELEDTPENMEACAKIAADVVRKVSPTSTIVFREKSD